MRMKIVKMKMNWLADLEALVQAVATSLPALHLPTTNQKAVFTEHLKSSYVIGPSNPDLWE